jgi:hypothetical protein
VRIDPGLARRLKAIAAMQGRSIRAVLDQIVPGPLRKIEDETVSKYSRGERPTAPAK